MTRYGIYNTDGNMSPLMSHKKPFKEIPDLYPKGGTQLIKKDTTKRQRQ